jgi:hypothetical protein
VEFEAFGPFEQHPARRDSDQRIGEGIPGAHMNNAMALCFIWIRQL